MEVYGSWKVPALRAELKKRGSKSSGRKDQLIERILAYDRNNNFQDDFIAEDEPASAVSTFNWPPDSSFKSVSEKSEKSPLNSVDITEYFVKTCENGAGITMCSMVLRKGYGMMESGFLAAMIEKRQDDHFFYQGQVNSEFTKRLTYFTKVVIAKDGPIVEASCECVAGAGSTAVCKHVAVTCYSVLRYNDRNVWPVRKTCTEKPQQWHMPKKQKIDVSPQKARQLSFHVPVYEFEKRKYGNLNFDPRAQEYRNLPSYNDSVRNAVINFRCYNGKRQFGIAGIYSVADVISLADDHDYLENPLLHQWVYNLIQGFASESEAIEKRARGESNTKEWHHIRSHIITASHVGEIVHMTERRNKVKYAEQLVVPRVFTSEATSWGKQHERIAIAGYESRSLNKVQPCGLILSKDVHFIGATSDGLVCILTVLEVKCPFSIRKTCISPECLDYLELNNGELCLKSTSNFYYQVQTQLFVTKREFCDFIVWIEIDFKRISVSRNDDGIFNYIIPKVTAFYQDYMVPAIVKHYYSA